MSEAASEAGGSAGAGPAPAPPPLHTKSFKLRFASQRELGRSNVSAVKPLRLPAVVRAKFYRREPEGEVEEERAARALARVRDMFARGPRERHAQPPTSASEYGWWAGAARAEPLRHHIRDSAWLKERVRVLAAGAGAARR